MAMSPWHKFIWGATCAHQVTVPSFSSFELAMCPRLPCDARYTDELEKYKKEDRVEVGIYMYLFNAMIFISGGRNLNGMIKGRFWDLGLRAQGLFRQVNHGESVTGRAFGL